MLKRLSGPVSKSLLTPFVSVGFAIVKFIGVPGYRAFFFLRRFFDKVFQPAKHRLLYLVTNRLSIHVFVILIVVTVGVTNFLSKTVRAETYGQKSILYALVASDDEQTLEVIQAGQNGLSMGATSSYLTDTVIDERAHIDFDGAEGFDGVDETGVFVREVADRKEIETYVVQDGDTLGKISEQFGLSVSTILWSNNLTLRSTIRPGDKFTILPVDGVLYTVKTGDTISKIAKTFSVEGDKILVSNSLSDTDRLKIGDQLLIPDASPPAQPVQIARRPVSVKDIFAPPSSKINKAKNAGWVWPTNWRSVTQYYSWKHSGIDIDGDYSTFSIAAHDGIVSYVGWRTGYGLTVEVDHGNGILTRYGHNSKNFVRVGQSVAAGENLAQTGSTGNSTGTHLHFEVMKNGTKQNPLTYIR